MKGKPKIIVIVGPTASGKSDLAIKLAKKYDGEVISADSRQVYRGLDIGTGKVLRDKTFPVPRLKLKILNFKFEAFYSKGIRHHLLDVASPKKEFTVSDFKKLGEKAIQEIFSQGKIPILVGGTGFYIDTLAKGLALPEVPPNKKLRKRLEKLSAERLFLTLKKLDPRRTRNIDPKNKRRLVRALEIILITGKKIPKLDMSPYPDRGKMMYLKIGGQECSLLWLGVKLSQEKLKKRIRSRLEKRLKQGLVQEVKRLLKFGVSWKRLYDFGLEYRQISEYLANKKLRVKSLNNFKKSEYCEKLIREIIKYSKRQLTWFKRNQEIHWIKHQEEAEKLTKKFLKSS